MVEQIIGLLSLVVQMALVNATCRYSSTLARNRVKKFLCSIHRSIMAEGVEGHSSDSSINRLQDALNVQRYEWPSKRELYTICGKLGEGATGTVSSPIERLRWTKIELQVSCTGPRACAHRRRSVWPSNAYP